MVLGSIFTAAAPIVGHLASRFLPKIGGFLANMAPKVLQFGKKAFGFMKNLPGFLGQAENSYRRGKAVVDGLISQLPDSKFKDKLHDMSDKADQTVGRVTDTVRPYADTAQQIGMRGERLANTVERLPWGRVVPAVAPQQTQQRII